MQALYVDQVFLLNLIINYLLLLATAKIAGVAAKRLRLLCGAVIGAAYAVLVWLPETEFLGGIAGKVIFGVLMVMAAFLQKGRHRLLRLTIIFTAASFALGGGIFAVELLVYGKASAGGIPALPIDFNTLLFAAALSYAILSIAFRRAARHGPADMLAVKIDFDGKTTDLTALLDTGNTLSDPLTGAAVLIIDSTTARRVLGFSIDDELLKNPVEAMELLNTGKARFRLLPYRAVGTDTGFMLAFAPDAVWYGKQKQPKTIVALSPTVLSDGGAYHALAGAR